MATSISSPSSPETIEYKHSKFMIYDSEELFRGRYADRAYFVCFQVHAGYPRAIIRNDSQLSEALLSQLTCHSVLQTTKNYMFPNLGLIEGFFLYWDYNLPTDFNAATGLGEKRYTKEEIIADCKNVINQIHFLKYGHYPAQIY